MSLKQMQILDGSVAVKPEQEPVAWPCLIDSADFSENTITLVMQCDDYKVSAGTHWLSTTPPQRTEQEPVGTVKDLFTQAAWERLDVRGSTKVYLDIPPQRKWVGLTAKETSDFVDQYWANDAVSMKELIGFVEAKLKEKNT